MTVILITEMKLNRLLNVDTTRINQFYNNNKLGLVYQTNWVNMMHLEITLSPKINT